MYTSKYLLLFALHPLLKFLHNTAKLTCAVGLLFFSMIKPSYALTAFASGFNGAFGLGSDSSGNLYVVDAGNKTIDKITSGGTVSTFASGFDAPLGLASDSSGNLYVSDYGNGNIDKITSAGIVSIFASGFGNPSGIAVDSSGNVYVDNGSIDKITSGGTVSTFASGFGNPSIMAVDSSGNIYVSNVGHGGIDEITSGGVVSTITPASGFTYFSGIAVDNSGNIYVSDVNNASIDKITSGGVVSTFASGFDEPGYLTIAGGNLYVSVADFNDALQNTSYSNTMGNIYQIPLSGTPVPFELSSPLGLSILGVFGIGQQLVKLMKNTKAKL